MSGGTRVIFGWLLIGTGLFEAVMSGAGGRFIWGHVARRLILFFGGQVNPLPAYASPLVLCMATTLLALPLLTPLRHSAKERLSVWIQALQVRGGWSQKAIRALSLSGADRLAAQSTGRSASLPSVSESDSASAVFERPQFLEVRRSLANLGVGLAVIAGIAVLISTSATLQGSSIGFGGLPLAGLALLIQLGILYTYFVGSNLPEGPMLPLEDKIGERL